MPDGIGCLPSAQHRPSAGVRQPFCAEGDTRLWLFRVDRRQSAAMRGVGSFCCVLVLLLGLAAGGVAAADDLYRAQAIVTGQGEAERARGLALCLEAVLIKVSGDPRLAGDPALAAMEQEAGRFVAGFSYHDRMSGIPVHDEQGTRERPYDLTVTFDPAKIDAALRSLGRAPWPAPRPSLVVLLGIRDATTAYVLAADGERGLGQRQALAAAAAKRGVEAPLPSEAQLAAGRLGYRRLAALAPTRLDALAKARGGDAALAGSLVWSEVARGWTARWRLSWRGRLHRWQIRGVSFDDVFRDAIDRAVAILSRER